MQVKTNTKTRRLQEHEQDLTPLVEITSLAYCMQRDLKTGPLRLTVHICKTPEQIGMIFDSLQRCFVLNTSVKSVVINFITRSGGAIPGDVGSQTSDSVLGQLCKIAVDGVHVLAATTTRNVISTGRTKRDTI